MYSLELQQFIGNEEITLSQAMQKIDTNTEGILFIVNTCGSLIGCITDGDIRRFLLSGGSISDLAINAANSAPRVAHTVEEAEKIYDIKNFTAIPVVDFRKKILSIYMGNYRKEKNYKCLNIPVVINAGGKGTRLDPFTRILPKPLIPVGELPIIELIMKEYRKYSCNSFHIIVNYKRELLKAYFHENENHYDITWYDEEKPLGTGGGLCFLRGKLNSTFFFANCDALLKADYTNVLQFHREQKNVITMVCALKNMTIPYGIIEMGVNGVINEMKEKPNISFLANTGIYIVEPEVLDDIEDDVSIGFPDIVEKQRKMGRKVAVFPVSENDWMDMGQFSELETMRKKLFGE